MKKTLITLPLAAALIGGASACNSGGNHHHYISPQHVVVHQHVTKHVTIHQSPLHRSSVKIRKH